MSADISIFASHRDLALLIEYTSYYFGWEDPTSIHRLNGDVITPEDTTALYRVLRRQEFLFPKKGRDFITVPFNLRAPLQAVRDSMATQGVGIRARDDHGSFVQRISEGILMTGRFISSGRI